ncbi:MAG: PEGA domain-containing protein [Candidatus Aminicenantales bacterium]
MDCPNCQASNPDDSLFCRKCGMQLPSLEKITLYRTQTLITKADEPVIGELFAQRYMIIDELGRGGMGRVFKALDKEINENIALKVLKPEISSDERMIERFRNELKLTRRISHPNVCRLYDLNKQGETYFITMEYISGDGLEALIKREGCLPISRAVTIARQICEGLAQAHSLGVVHRDLKPHNIMIDGKDHAHIMDFGIARSIKAEGMTRTGDIIGTPEYMSPEQLEGKSADHRSDIYSLGVILYEMLTQRVPFAGDNPFQIAIRQKTEPPEDPRHFNPQIPGDVSRVIEKCLEKDRTRRYQTTADLLNDLRKIERDILTADVSIPGSSGKPARSRKRLPLVLSVLFVAVLALGYLFYDRVLSSREPGEAPEPQMAAEKMAIPPASERAAGPPSEADVEITSIPGGADVYLDGRFEGKTPFTRSLKTGSYRVLVRKEPGYREMAESLEVEAGKKTLREFTLVPLTLNNIRIDSNPRGAEVLVGAEIKGQTPLEFTLEPGIYEIKVKKEPEYKEVADHWKIIKAEPFTKSYALDPVYLVEIETVPEDSEVSLDGVPKGRSPLKIELSKNRCQLVIEKGDQWTKINEPLFLNPGRNLIRRSLTKIKHSLFIKTNPSGASVSINGIPVGVSPVKKMDLAGDCNIRIEKTGYASISDTIKVEADVERTYDLINIEAVSPERKDPLRAQYGNSTLEIVDIWNDFGSGDADVYMPLNVAVDKAGNVYVTGQTRHTICRFSSGGEYLNKWIEQVQVDGKTVSPYGMAIDGSGFVYVTDIDNHRIVKFNEDGSIAAIWGTYGRGERSVLNLLRNPTGIALDGSGAIYVCDTGNNRVVKLNNNGEVIGSLGSKGEGAGQLLRPTGIAVDNNGVVYVADRGNRKIAIFSSGGNLIGEFGRRLGISGSELKSPAGIAVDNLGYMYIIDPGNHKIFKLNLFGTLVAEQGGFGKEAGQLEYPQGIAVDSQGYAYVADTNNDRVQKYRIK